ncbi:hypothetical protein QQ045_017841 [Rhodiola kirilowii]
MKPSDVNQRKIEIWLQMHEVPIQIRDKTTAKEVATKVGGLVVREGMKNVEVKGTYLRVRIEMPVDVPIRRGLLLQFPDDEPDQWITFRYERLPNVCFRCGRLTHVTSRCVSSDRDMSGKKFGPWLRAESKVQVELMGLQKGGDTDDEESSEGERRMEKSTVAHQEMEERVAFSELINHAGILAPDSVKRNQGDSPNEGSNEDSRFGAGLIAIPDPGSKQTHQGGGGNGRPTVDRLETLVLARKDEGTEAAVFSRGVGWNSRLEPRISQKTAVKAGTSVAANEVEQQLTLGNLHAVKVRWTGMEFKNDNVWPINTLGPVDYPVNDVRMDFGDIGESKVRKNKGKAKLLGVWGTSKGGKQRLQDLRFHPYQVKTKMRTLTEQLDSIRKMPRDESVIKDEENLVSQLDEWKLREEIFWKQRSRVEWMAEGDMNTKFFHAKASHRRKINTIEEIQDNTGKQLREEKDIAEQIRCYFSGLFESSIKNKDIDWNQRLMDVQSRIPDGSDSVLWLSCNPSLAWRSIWQVGQKVKENIVWIEEEQKWWWIADSNGVFSTKSAYMYLKVKQDIMFRDLKGECSDKSLVKSFWRKLWRLKMQGKVKIFTWRLFHDFLPSSLNLARRGCATDLRCKHLSQDNMIMLCYGARLIWYNRNLLAHGREGLQRTDSAGFGCVARDEEGIILGVLAEVVAGATSVVHIEVLAILKAMEWAGANGWNKCIFETDCEEAYSIIAQLKVGSGSVATLARSCQWRLLGEDDWKVVLVRRQANALADALANKARRDSWSWNSVVAIPRLPGLFA